MPDVELARRVEVDWTTFKTLIRNKANWRIIAVDPHDMAIDGCAADKCSCRLYPATATMATMYVFTSLDVGYDDVLMFCTACIDASIELWIERHESQSDLWIVDPHTLAKQ